MTSERRTEGPGSVRPEEQAPRVRLAVLSGEQRGRRIFVHPPFTIGRSNTDLTLLDEEVSRKHAEIYADERGDWRVRDAGSLNGTRVNGQQTQDSALRVGDEIEIGSIRLRLEPYDPEEEQRQQRERLEALGRLGAGIAHDLNNSLCAARANLELLVDHPELQSVGDSELWEILRDMRFALERASDLAPRFLHLARSERQPFTRVEMSELAREATSLFGRTLDRSIRLEVRIAPRLAVLGDPTCLHQILMNLLLNARDSMTPGGGELRIDVEKLADAHLSGLPLASSRPHVVITVSDTGCGMDEEVRARIFEPFFTTKAQGTSYGLGLSTTRDLVAEHSGHIEVSSVHGKGSTFRVYIPAAPSAARTMPSRRTSLGRPQSSEPGSAGSGLLLVDDDPMVRRSLARVLRRVGYEVAEARDGQEAIDQIDGDHDLVLLDVDMPVLDGEQTFREIRAKRPNLSVLVITGHTDDDRVRRMLAAGASGCLHKPIDVSDLVRRVGKLSREHPSVPPEAQTTGRLDRSKLLGERAKD